MTEPVASPKKEIKNVQVSVDKDLSTVTIGDSKVEVSADGKKVTAYTNADIETKTAGATAASEQGTKISISKDFNAVVLNGVTIELEVDGRLVITAPGVNVIRKPAPANDTSGDVLPHDVPLLVGGINGPRLQCVAGWNANRNFYQFSPGGKAVDGSIFAGETDDGKKRIFVMPKDLGVALTFNEAAKAVEELNKNKELGHDDWEILSLQDMRVVCRNKGYPRLKDIFTKAGSSDNDNNDRWGTSTKHPSYENPDYTLSVSFDGSKPLWSPSDGSNRLLLTPINKDRHKYLPARRVAPPNTPKSAIL